MSKKLRELQARKAAAVDAMKALNAKAEFNAEDQTSFDAHAADLKSINAAIERETFLAANVVDLPHASATATVSVSDNRAADPKFGFQSFGDFSKAVAQAGMGKSFDERLNIGASAPGTFSNESAGADGGFAIPPQFSQELWRLSLGEESLLPMTANTELTGNSMIFPKDESTPWGGSGAQVFWQAEALAAAQSKVQIGSQAMVLHKMMGLVPVTNELIEDGFAIGSYLTPLLADRITWKTNEAILFGTGVGQPLGALTNAGNTGSPAIVQAKETGQAPGTLDAKNITKMVQRLLVGELKNSIWIGTPDILSPLEALTVGQFPVYLPNTNMAESPYGMLKGRPLNLSEHAAAFSSQSDLSLLSLKGYRTITKAGGIQTDTSMHLYFDADATAMRVRFRVNGMPILGAPVMPPKSGNTRSHFVTLAAR
jgi:HK97 family phage major capsid protein